jgi:hypothetical protein
LRSGRLHAIKKPLPPLRKGGRKLRSGRPRRFGAQVVGSWFAGPQGRCPANRRPPRRLVQADRESQGDGQAPRQEIFELQRTAVGRTERQAAQKRRPKTSVRAVS